jgi:hypothetical protein
MFIKKLVKECLKNCDCNCPNMIYRILKEQGKTVVCFEMKQKDDIEPPPISQPKGGVLLPKKDRCD